MNKTTVLQDLRDGKITIEEATKLLELEEVYQPKDPEEPKEVKKPFVVTVDINDDEKIVSANEIGKEISSKVIEIKNQVLDSVAKSMNVFKNHPKEKNKEHKPRNESLEKIIKLAPFASSNTLSKLIKKLLESENTIDWDSIAQLAPFLLNEDIKVLFEEAFKHEKPNIDLIMAIVPFIDPTDLGAILVEHYDKLTFDQISELAPFLGEEEIDLLIEKMVL